MSIAVPLADLAATLEAYPWGYILTVGDDQRSHLLAVPSTMVEGVFVVDAGRSARANAATRPEVTLVFPPATGREFSLVGDGTATVVGEQVHVSPTWAVLHRPALRD